MFRNFKPSRLIVTIGFSGSGKSYLAKQLEKHLGYRVLRSDVIRKELAGLNPLHSAKTDFGKGIYSPEMTKRVYQTLVDRAKELIARGEKVILDATFLKRWQRELVLRNFPTATFVQVIADEDTIKKRLTTRKNDPSDADYSVYLKQKETFEPPTELLTTFVVRSDEWEKLIPFLKD